MLNMIYGNATNAFNSPKMLDQGNLLWKCLIRKSFKGVQLHYLEVLVDPNSIVDCSPLTLCYE